MDSILGLGLDFETTGLDTNTTQITEVGISLFDFKNFIPIRLESYLIKLNDHALIDPDAVACNGIDKEYLDTYGADERRVISCLNNRMDSVDYVMAHNGRAFDKLVYESTCRRLGIAPIEKIWVDTMEDVDYPAHIHARKLVHLAAEHGFINPFPHRAVFDVVTMLKVCSCYSGAEILENAVAPKVLVEALVSFANKDLAKNLKFNWDGGSRRWIKKVRAGVQADELILAAQNAGFQAVIRD